MAGAAANYNAMLSKLNPEATPGTPLSVQELYDAYCAITGKSMEVEVFLAEMTASYSIGQIQGVRGHQKQDGSEYDPVIDGILYGVDRKANVPPIRGALQDFDTSVLPIQGRKRAENYAWAVHNHRGNLSAAYQIAVHISNAGLLLDVSQATIPPSYLPAQHYNSQHTSSLNAPRLFMAHPCTSTSLYITGRGFIFIVKYSTPIEADAAANSAASGQKVSFPSVPYLITGGSSQMVRKLWVSTAFQHVVITRQVIVNTQHVDPFIVVGVAVWWHSSNASGEPQRTRTRKWTSA